jgi:hypothetical protein
MVKGLLIEIRGLFATKQKMKNQNVRLRLKKMGYSNKAIQEIEKWIKIE